ncbi:LysR family transcriptional regulator [Sphingomonas tabacisoli]|uniref:LysR family transcriptional regulator n=1 Tax=Sphingomonas tabacisoli TaxID=2249466 RepID=A0ABW4I6V6_9SPHN
MQWEWTDARYFLAVARDGATLRAANRLGVNQTTCARRIAALEEALQLKLFTRSGSGYELTDAGRALVPAAEALEAAADGFAATAGATSRGLNRALRLTTAEAFERRIAAPALAAARRRLPGLRCELEVTTDKRDLVRGDADIAIRGGPPPQDGGLICRRLGDIVWGVYRHVSYPHPVSMDAIGDHAFASVEGQALAGLKALVPEARVVQITSTLQAVIETLRAGDCIAGLPTFVGDHEADLVRCGLVDEGETDWAIWLLYPERLRGSPEVRVMADCIVEQMAATRQAA